jgi:membrane protein implicated in regulation of membrane protease activity
VEFHGTDWAAEADEEIPEGTMVEIIGKENITLKVKIL